jgi:hypothetical protein
MFFKQFVTGAIIIFIIHIIAINTYSVFASDIIPLPGGKQSNITESPQNNNTVSDKAEIAKPSSPEGKEGTTTPKEGKSVIMKFDSNSSTKKIIDLKDYTLNKNYTISKDPKNGIADKIEDGKWSYISFKNFVGTDNFTLTSNLSATTYPEYDIIMTVKSIPKPTPLRYTTTNNTIKVIDLKQDIKNNIQNVDYYISSYPKNGTVEKTDEGKWSYLSFPNFVGTDNFTLTSNRNIPIDPVYDIKMKVEYRKAFTPIWPFSDLSQNQRLLAALIVAFVVVLAIVLVVWRITWKSKYERENLKYTPKFSDFIRTPDWDPSLSIFQFLLWTTVVIFTYLALYLFRIFNGVSEPPQGGIPTNLLLLMGLSIGTPIASSYITSTKRGPGELIDVPPKDPRPRLSLMLYEFDKLTLSRFQMFAWTWVSILIYLYAFIPAVTDHYSDPQNATVPNIDLMLVALMGLSQAAFLAGKAANPKLRISSIYPEVGRIGERISIFGSNFGNNKDIVWFNNRPIKTEGLDDVIWLNGERIDLTIPEDIPPGDFSIRVSNGGFLSEPFKPPYKILAKGEQQQKSDQANGGDASSIPPPKKQANGGDASSIPPPKKQANGGDASSIPPPP